MEQYSHLLIYISEFLQRGRYQGDAARSHLYNHIGIGIIGNFNYGHFSDIFAVMTSHFYVVVVVCGQSNGPTTI